VKNLRDFGARELRNLCAAVGRDGDEPLGFQQAQGIAYGNSAHGKARGEVFLPEQRAGPRRAGQDVGAQRGCDGLRRGALAPARGRH
jgi:hypothetical protein